MRMPLRRNGKTNKLLPLACLAALNTKQQCLHKKVSKFREMDKRAALQ